MSGSIPTMAFRDETIIFGRTNHSKAKTGRSHPSIQQTMHVKQYLTRSDVLIWLKEVKLISFEVSLTFRQKLMASRILLLVITLFRFKIKLQDILIACVSICNLFHLYILYILTLSTYFSSKTEF